MQQENIGIQWIASPDFRLNAYRLVANGQMNTMLVLAPKDSFNENDPIIQDWRDMGYQINRTQAGSYAINLGGDPDDSKLHAFVSAMHDKGYSNVEATPFRKNIAFMYDRNDAEHQAKFTISEKQLADTEGQTVTSNRPFITVNNPQVAGVSIGAVIPEITEEEARKIDANSFAYQGGQFIHANHIQRDNTDYVNPKWKDTFVVNDMTLKSQIEVAVMDARPVYYGGVMYVAAPQAEGGDETYVQSYLGANNQPSSDLLFQKMRAASGYIPRNSAGFDVYDAAAAQARHIAAIEQNERILNTSGIKNDPNLITTKLQNINISSNIDPFFSLANNGNDTYMTAKDSSVQRNIASPSFVSDADAKTIVSEARQLAGKEIDNNAFISPNPSPVISQSDAHAMMRELSLANLECVRNQQMMDNEVATIDPRLIRTMRELVDKSNFDNEEQAVAALKITASPDTPLQLRTIQNDLQFKYGPDAIAQHGRVKAALINAAMSGIDQEGEIKAYAQSLIDITGRTSADVAALRMLNSGITADRAAAQNYFRERYEIFDAQKNSDADPQTIANNQRLFKQYFSELSPARNGLPLETFINKQFAHQPYREAGQFLKKLDGFEQEFKLRLQSIDNQDDLQNQGHSRRLEEATSYDREAIGEKDFYARFGVMPAKYETLKKDAKSTHHDVRYLFNDDKNFHDLLVKVDQMRKQNNTTASLFRNIPKHNWGPDQINRSKFAVREEYLTEVPDHVIMRQPLLQEKFERNKNRDNSGMAEHVFVKKGGYKEEGYILRGFPLPIIQEVCPHARWDANAINDAGYQGKGTFVPKQYAWMLTDAMTNDLSIVQRKEEAELRRQKQQNIDFSGQANSSNENSQQRKEIEISRQILDLRAQAMFESSSFVQSHLNKDFANAMITALHNMDERGIGSPARRLETLNYFADFDLNQKLEKLQNAIPARHIDVSTSTRKKMEDTFSQDVFLEYVSSQIQRQKNAPKQTNPHTPLIETDIVETAHTQDKAKAAVMAHAEALSLAIERDNTRLPEDKRISGELVQAYKEALKEAQTAYSKGDFGNNSNLVRHLAMSSSDIINELRPYRNLSDDRMAISIRDMLSESPAKKGYVDKSTLPEKEYYESQDLAKARKQYSRANNEYQVIENALQNNSIDATEGQARKETLKVELQEAITNYAVGIVREVERIDNSFQRYKDDESVKEQFAATRSGLNSQIQALGLNDDQQARIQAAENRIANEPNRKANEEAFVEMHRFDKGTYTKANGEKIQGYYFDPSKSFRDALSDVTHPQFPLYRHKVFGYVGTNALDSDDNKGRAFVRAEELALLPTGVVRDNSLHYEENALRRQNAALTGTKENPLVLNERLRADEPSREDTDAFFNHFHADKSYFVTKSENIIPGYYIHINGNADKADINKLGTELNMIYGGHVYPSVSEDSVPDAKYVGMAFVKATSADKIPVELLREHARMVELETINADRDYSNLPTYEHLKKDNTVIHGRFIPGFTEEELKKQMPRTLSELSSGEYDENAKKDQFVFKAVSMPMPFVREEALKYLSDDVIENAVLDSEQLEILVNNSKANENRVHMIVDAYNQVNPNKTVSFDDQMVLATAEYNYQINEKRTAARLAQREALEQEEDSKVSEADLRAEVAQTFTRMLQKEPESVELSDDNEIDVDEIFDGAIDKIVNDYESSDDPRKQEIAQAYNNAFDEWYERADEQGLTTEDFDDLLNRYNAEDRLIELYNTGLLSDFDALAEKINNEDDPLAYLSKNTTATSESTTETVAKDERVSEEKSDMPFIFAKKVSISDEIETALDKLADKDDARSKSIASEFRDQTDSAIMGYYDIKGINNYFAGDTIDDTVAKITKYIEDGHKDLDSLNGDNPRNEEQRKIAYAGSIELLRVSIIDGDQQIAQKLEALHKEISGKGIAADPVIDYFGEKDTTERLRNANKAGSLDDMAAFANMVGYNPEQITQLTAKNDAPVQGESKEERVSKAVDATIKEWLNNATDTEKGTINAFNKIREYVQNSEHAKWFTDYLDAGEGTKLHINSLAEHIAYSNISLLSSQMNKVKPEDIDAGIVSFRKQLEESSNIDNSKESTAEKLLKRIPMHNLSVHDAMVIGEYAMNNMHKTEALSDAEKKLYNRFKGWQEVVEVKTRQLKEISEAALQHPILTGTASIAEAREFATKLMLNNANNQNTTPNTSKAIWQSLAQGNINVKNALDISSHNTDLILAGKAEQADVFIRDRISAFIEKAKANGANISAEDGLLANIPKDHYNVMVTRLENPLQKTPITDHKEGIQFSDRAALQAHRLSLIENGGIAVLITPKEFGDVTSTANNIRLRELNDIAKNFNLIAAVEVPKTLTSTNEQLLFLQRTNQSIHDKPVENPIIALDENDSRRKIFSAGLNMAQALAELKQESKKAIMPEVNSHPKLVDLINTTADQIKQNFKEVVAAAETANVSDNGVDAKNKVTLKADELNHKIAVAEGGYIQHEGKFLEVISKNTSGNNTVYDAIPVAANTPANITAAYLSLRDDMVTLTRSKPESEGYADAVKRASESYDKLTQALGTQSLSDSNAKHALRHLIDETYYPITMLAERSPEQGYGKSPLLEGKATEQSAKGIELAEAINYARTANGINLDKVAALTGQSAEQVKEQALNSALIYQVPALTSYAKETYQPMDAAKVNLDVVATQSVLANDNALREHTQSMIVQRAATYTPLAMGLGDSAIDARTFERYLNEKVSTGAAVKIERGTILLNKDVQWKLDKESNIPSFENSDKFKALNALSPTDKSNAIAHMLNNTHFEIPTDKVMSKSDRERLVEANREIDAVRERFANWIQSRPTTTITYLSKQTNAIKEELGNSSGSLLSLGGITTKASDIENNIKQWAASRKSEDKPILMVVPKELVYDTAQQLQAKNPELNIVSIKSMTRNVEQDRIERAKIANADVNVVVMSSDQFTKNPYANSLESRGLAALSPQAMTKLHQAHAIDLLNRDLGDDGLSAKKFTTDILKTEKKIESLGNQPNDKSLYVDDRFSAVVVRDNNLLADKGIDNVINLARASDDTKVVVLTDNKYAASPELGIKVASVNRPELLAQASINDSQSFAERKLVSPVNIDSSFKFDTLDWKQGSAHQHELAMTILNSDKRANKEDLAEKLAAAAIDPRIVNKLYPASDEYKSSRIADTVDVSKIPEGKVDVILLDSKYINSDSFKVTDYIVDRVQERYKNEAVNIVRADILPADAAIRAVNSNSDSKLVIATSDSIEKGLNLQNKVNAIYHASMPAPDDYNDYAAKVKALDATAKNVGIYDSTSLDSVNNSIITSAAKNNVSVVPSEVQIVKSEHAPAIVMNKDNAAEIYANSEIAQQLTKQATQYGYDANALRIQESQAVKYALAGENVEEWIRSAPKSEDLQGKYAALANGLLIVRDADKNVDLSPFTINNIPLAADHAREIIQEEYLLHTMNKFVSPNTNIEYEGHTLKAVLPQQRFAEYSNDNALLQRADGKDPTVIRLDEMMASQYTKSAVQESAYMQSSAAQTLQVASDNSARVAQLQLAAQTAANEIRKNNQSLDNISVSLDSVSFMAAASTIVQNKDIFTEKAVERLNTIYTSSSNHELKAATLALAHEIDKSDKDANIKSLIEKIESSSDAELKQQINQISQYAKSNHEDAAKKLIENVVSTTENKETVVKETKKSAEKKAEKSQQATAQEEIQYEPQKRGKQRNMGAE